MTMCHREFEMTVCNRKFEITVKDLTIVTGHPVDIFFRLKFSDSLQSELLLLPSANKFSQREAELAWPVSRYLRRGSLNFKIKYLDDFSPSFFPKNVNFKT